MNGGQPREWLERNISEILRLSTSPLAGEIIEKISEFVKNDCSQLTTHQIRIVLGSVKRAKTEAQIKVAIPHLAYVASKQEKDTQNREIVEFFLKILKAVEREKEKDHVRECHHFFESVVAFHKFHHGDLKNLPKKPDQNTHKRPEQHKPV